MEKRKLFGVILVVVGVVGLVVAAPLYYLSQWNYQPAPGQGGWNWPRMGMGWQSTRGPAGVPAGGQITMDQAVAIAESYLASLNNPDLAIHEIMEFEYNFYIIYYEKSTGIGAFEMLIDKPGAPRGSGMGGGMMGGGMMSGVIRPEPGPNMMWNTKYRMMGGGGMMGGGMMGSWRGTPTANMPISAEQAKAITLDYLSVNLPGASVEDPDVFYGYYTIHILKDGKIYGMLSVNGYAGQVWYHSWHGAFIQMREFD